MDPSQSSNQKYVVERVQTGVRMEKRLLKVLRGAYERSRTPTHRGAQSTKVSSRFRSKEDERLLCLLGNRYKRPFLTD